jgi:hypothetical protein
MTRSDNNASEPVEEPTAVADRIRIWIQSRRTSREELLLPNVRRSVRSVEAAAIAGIVFSVLFVAALLIMQGAPGFEASPAEISRFYDDPDAVHSVVVGIQLVPISVIALVWFIAVVRRRIGDREDKLFSTVFMGGGLLFAALVLVGAATAGAPALVTELTGRSPDPETTILFRGVGSALLTIQGPRIGSLFIFSASTLGLRTGAFPRWLSLLGYVLGLSLLIPLPFIDAWRFAFPAWVGVASLALLIRVRIAPLETPPPTGDEGH